MSSAGGGSLGGSSVPVEWVVRGCVGGESLPLGDALSLAYWGNTIDKSLRSAPLESWDIIESFVVNTGSGLSLEVGSLS